MCIRDCCYSLPSPRILSRDLIAMDHLRIAELSDQIRFFPNLRESSGAGIRSVHAYADHDHAIQDMMILVRTLLEKSAILPRNIDLIVDFSTVPNNDVSLGPTLCEVLQADSARCLSIGSGACSGLHIALWTAEGMLQSDPQLHQILLVSSDRVPPRSRVMFPLTILGDGASAMLIGRESPKWEIIGNSLFTAGHLRHALGVPSSQNQPIHVDIHEIETKLMPAHFKAISRVLSGVLDPVSLSIDQVDHFIYPSMSETDRKSFCRAFKIPETKLLNGRLEDAGHVFASDMIISLKEAETSGKLHPGETIVLLASGAGFHWGGTLLRCC